LGLSLPSIDDRSKQITENIIKSIDKNCPTVLANATLAREFLVAADEELICREFLDMQPKPVSLVSLWFETPRPKLISHIPWNLDLAMLAVSKSPFFYKYLPEEMKRGNKDLAFATVFGDKLAAIKEGDGLKTIVKQVHSCCPSLFSNLATMSKLLVIGEENVVMTVLGTFHYEIVWDQGLADGALERFPVVNFFLPESFRNGAVDVQHAVELLVKGLADVDEVIDDCPALLADAAALEEVFHGAKAKVTVIIVQKRSSTLPWNRDLIRLAAKVCYSGERGSGIADKDIEGVYKECRCNHHLPLGMILSPVLAAKMDVWPDFLNHCPCALVQDDSSVLAALNFMGPMLQIFELPPGLQNWLLGFVDAIKLLFQNRQSFQTLLKCIARAGREGQEPLSLFPRDVETNDALIHYIFEFLVGTPTTVAEMKYDAFYVVYCLITFPCEFVGEMGAPSKVIKYMRPNNNEETFFCKWFCDALAELDEKYNGNPNTRKRATRNSDDDDFYDEDSDEGQ
jgi:hypothetical protein